MFSLTTCDVIENPVKENTGNFNWNGRKILLYDFTAHQCVYCPEGHEIINELKEIYGDSLIIAVSIHCTALSNVLPIQAGMYNYDFRTSIGDELGGRGTEGGYYGSLSLPIGLINTLSKDKLSRVTTWPVEIQKMISTFPEFSININSSFSEDSTIYCDIKITTNFETSRQLNLITFLTEDDIIKDQLTLQGFRNDYVHDNVFRAGFNGTWGETIKNNNSVIYPKSEFEKSYNISAKTHDWQINNCKIVSFIYDSETFEILQVEETKIL